MIPTHPLEIALHKAGMTQRVLCLKLGIKSPTISQMKRGDFSNPARWKQIAELLNVTVDYLTSGSVSHSESAFAIHMRSEAEQSVSRAEFDALREQVAEMRAEAKRTRKKRKNPPLTIVSKRAPKPAL